MLAPLLAIASLGEHGALQPSTCIALAAACWTFVELSRTTSSPLVAMLPATIAALLEPGAIVLLPIAGTRLVTAPWQRPRWAIAVPVLGGLAVLLAVITGTARDGVLADLARHWYGGAPQSMPSELLAPALGDALGPLTAVAAIAGIALLLRFRLVELAILTCLAGALLVDLRRGTIGAATLGLAALCAGLAVGRFAASIRLAPLQAVAGATAALILLVPPAWTTIEHGPRVAITRPSR